MLKCFSKGRPIQNSLDWGDVGSHTRMGKGRADPKDQNLASPQSTGLPEGSHECSHRVSRTVFLDTRAKGPPIFLNNTSTILIIDLGMVNIHLTSTNLKYLYTNEEQKFISVHENKFPNKAN